MNEQAKKNKVVNKTRVFFYIYILPYQLVCFIRFSFLRKKFFISQSPKTRGIIRG
jgi:hypothetical protein